jgi:hypothetical protein
MVKFRSSPEDAAAYAADKILENRQLKLAPVELVHIFLGKKYGPLMFAMLALLLLVNVYVKGWPWMVAIIDVVSFLGIYTAMWAVTLVFCKYLLRKEALKPEYDWAVEYKILHGSDQELDLIEELPE